MRILLVSHRFDPDVGGIETVVGRQAENLAEKGHEVRVVTTTGDESIIGERNERGIIVNRVSRIAPNNSFFFSPKVGRLVGDLAGEYDIIHAHNYHALPALHAFRNRGRSVFVLTAHYHRTSDNRFRNMLLGPYRKIAKRMVETSDSVICVSESERSLLEGDFAIQEIHVNYNAVEAVKGAFERVQGAFCIIGRIEKYKKIEQAIISFEKAISRIDSEISLHIVGDGPERSRLENMVERRGLVNHVKFYGFVSAKEKDRILSSSSCLLALSSHESFGITVVEAAKQNVPIIASDIPAHRELASLLGEGVSIVDPEDIGSISDKIVRLVSSDFNPRFNNLEVFTWERNTEKLLEIYDGLLV
tara:strand:- start:10783 stop:11862 length:1080 start_codon:yes stop_codon:yes gene_type:complete